MDLPSPKIEQRKPNWWFRGLILVALLVSLTGLTWSTCPTLKPDLTQFTWETPPPPEPAFDREAATFTERIQHDWSRARGATGEWASEQRDSWGTWSAERRDRMADWWDENQPFQGKKTTLTRWLDDTVAYCTL